MTSGARWANSHLATSFPFLLHQSNDSPITTTLITHVPEFTHVRRLWAFLSSPDIAYASRCNIGTICGQCSWSELFPHSGSKPAGGWANVPSKKRPFKVGNHSLLRYALGLSFYLDMNLDLDHPAKLLGREVAEELLNGWWSIHGEKENSSEIECP